MFTPVSDDGPDELFLTAQTADLPPEKQGSPWKFSGMGLGQAERSGRLVPLAAGFPHQFRFGRLQQLVDHMASTASIGLPATCCQGLALFDKWSVRAEG